MENIQLIPFAFGDHLVRIVPDENGDPWFVAKDILRALEYPESTLSNMGKAIQHVPHEWQGRYPIPTPGGTQEMLTLSEQGLYFFLGRSDKPKALPFQKWLAGEVVPQIRKTGQYKIGRPLKLALPEEMPSSALAIKPAMRQKLWRDALRTASLECGGINEALVWFDRLCRMVAAAPPAEPDAADKVRRFYLECCQEAPGIKTAFATLYQAFQHWHKGMGNIPSKKVFGSCMKEYGRLCRSNGSYYEGITLK